MQDNPTAIEAHRLEGDSRLGRLARLLAAVLAVQIFFWGVFNPVFIQPDTDAVEFIDVTSLSAARLESPELQGIAKAQFRETQIESSLHFPRGYHGLRAGFALTQVPSSGLALLDQNGGSNTRIYVNGQVLSGEGRMALPDVTYHGLTKQIIRIPPGLLRPGTNTIDHIRTYDIPQLAGNLPLLLGEYDAVSNAFGWKNFLLGSGQIISLTVGCVLALLVLVALLRSENKAFLSWLFLLTAIWSLRSHFYLWAEIPLHGFARGFYYAFITLFLSACWPILIDQWSGKPLRYFKPLVLAIFAVAASAIAAMLLLVQGDRSWDEATDLLDQAGMLFMALMLARMVWHFWTVREDRHWEAAILITLGMLVAIFLFNIMVWGRNTPYLTLSQPLFLLAFAVAFFSRNFRLFQSSAQINTLLQAQLDARTAELEEAHAREKAFVRLEAHGQERQRIMRDMHDGLGSSLMSMLMMAKRGKAQPEDYAEGLQQVIDEMRLMIDSMDSVGESLASALAIFRKRVVPRARAAGFDCVWEQDRATPLPEYGPRTILQIFRILQEAYTNALKHSGGDRISIAIKASEDPAFAVVIAVTDNGTGIARRSGRGRGLDNMQARAATIGGRLAIEHGETGTTVRLEIPHGDEAQAIADRRAD
ncbi:sensor histidine kinase [Erythrobacter sp. JK5]|uniref:sensor histidine kinase n=1 Tax=Erythrobacter sp. JK5 TaxID=2829500 RepID=UPI001BA904ED|nr:ATP-binding protein [Erythrobacter sp. JK5]QUL36764.1 hypothetical protein KDC96_10080 [Erythrobacter sp. JK5]